jgi:hypothetical protein
MSDSKKPSQSNVGNQIKAPNRDVKLNYSDGSRGFKAPTQSKKAAPPRNPSVVKPKGSN